ncbi:hypothetical protein MILUP08_43132 [Micromonospora lupini str. Lupac 08]|uniref:Uncharacterized protein n=1 Tax=Micromonospora lupini str. Lupac 08 TaxID=1150864 RepID=I0L330_9ACTN|nr:hypothetical protein MILUP08_43132 [Micromonospora lupini str. Lupac 08]
MRCSPPPSGGHVTATKVSHFHLIEVPTHLVLGTPVLVTELATRTTSHAVSGRKVREDAYEGLNSTLLGGARRGPRHAPAAGRRTGRHRRVTGHHTGRRNRRAHRDYLQPEVW